LLEGPFIEAGFRFGIAITTPLLPLLLEGPFIEAIKSLRDDMAKANCPSFWRGPSLRLIEYFYKQF
ncbi:hypothetical protein, partial [Propionibacterium freudenreichii]|uniref:hypothetical protein n=1 Tax=Propionibacterium freudenreichii TaxID=1744 RepID=UPI001E571650